MFLEISQKFTGNQPPVPVSLFQHRTSHPEIFCKKDVLRNFAKCTSLNSATLLKKRLRHRYLPVNYAKYLRTPLLQNTSERLLPFWEIDILKKYFRNSYFRKINKVLQSTFLLNLRESTFVEYIIFLQLSFDLSLPTFST